MTNAKMLSLHDRVAHTYRCEGGIGGPYTPMGALKRCKRPATHTTLTGFPPTEVRYLCTYHVNHWTDLSNRWVGTTDTRATDERNQPID